MSDSSDEENVKSPSDWVDSPLFKDDEDEFETITATPPPAGFTKDEEGRIITENYDFRTNRIIRGNYPPSQQEQRGNSRSVTRTHRGYTNNKTKGGGSRTLFMEEHVRRERESYGMEKTLDMDFGFEKEVCGFPDSEAISVEVLEGGTPAPLIAVGSLEKLMIFDYTSGDLVCDLGSKIEYLESCIRRDDPWLVDDMLYMKKHRTLFVSLKNLLGFARIGSNGKIGNLKFRKTKNIEGLDLSKIISRRIELRTWEKYNECLRIKTNENQTRMLKVDDDSFLFQLIAQYGPESGVSHFAVLKIGEEEEYYDNLHIVPSGAYSGDTYVPLIHPKEKSVLIIGHGSKIHFRNIQTFGTVDVSRDLSKMFGRILSRRDSGGKIMITSLGYIIKNEGRGGLLVIGMRSGEICTLDLLRDTLTRHVVKLEKQVNSILINPIQEKSGSAYFICGSETQRAYAQLLGSMKKRVIVRKNIKIMTRMRWCPVSENIEIGTIRKEFEPQYFVTSDRNGGVCSWRNIFYFERKDELERCKSVLFECLDAVDDEDQFFEVFTIKIYGGKDIFVMKSFF